MDVVIYINHPHPGLLPSREKEKNKTIVNKKAPGG